MIVSSWKTKLEQFKERITHTHTHTHIPIEFKKTLDKIIVSFLKHAKHSKDYENFRNKDQEPTGDIFLTGGLLGPHSLKSGTRHERGCHRD